jgi:hypothetical protein
MISRSLPPPAVICVVDSCSTPTCEESIDASTPCTQFVGTCVLVTERWVGGRSTNGRSGNFGAVSPWPSQAQTMPPRSAAW